MESTNNIVIGDGYALRQWRLTDETALVKYANNRKIWLNLRDAFPHPYTLADAREYLSRHRNEDFPNVFAIDNNGAAIGSIALHPQDDVHRLSAEIGYWLGEPFWGKGVTTRAVKAICQYGFSRLHLVRIYAAVFEWNPASMRVLEKAGFVREGTLRKYVLKDGTIINSVQFALVSAE